jgi:uncharacterized protein YgiM (DUF1202 family)
MDRRWAVWLLVGLLALVSLACNAFAGESRPVLTLPPPRLTVLPGTAVADLPPGPIIAPTVTLPGENAPPSSPATPVSPDGRPRVRLLVDLNIRSGPSVQYERVGFLLGGDTAVILGQHADSGWWRIECPPLADGNQCWVSGGSQYTVASNTDSVPTIPAPPR